MTGVRSELLQRMTRTGLYLVTDDRLEDDALLDRLDAALAAGADVVQLRDKRDNRRHTYDVGRRIAERCHAHGAMLIVNDQADLAVVLGAEGVHVGQEDLPAHAVRQVVGERVIIGLSVSHLSEARVVGESGADYIGFGALFPSPTKADAEPAGPDMLEQARPLVKMPVVGIGGITADNLAAAIAAGADAVAVVSAVFSAQDPAAATRTLLARIQGARQR
ncbi:MAG: thiamine phosphate synthase [Chloroflexota bacterium]